MPSSGSSPRQNRSGGGGDRAGGARPKGPTADRATRKAIANVVTGNQVEVGALPVGMAVGNVRVEVEVPVVVREGPDLDQLQ
jgi:hypothetical protein